MSRVCPSCGMEVEVDDRFCTGCGAKLASSDEAASEAGAIPTSGSLSTASPIPVSAEFAPLPGLSETDPAASPTESPVSDLLVEVETNRPCLRKHASLLRFRVTNMRPDTACDVTLRMCLQGQGRFVEQEAEDREQTCRLRGRGDPHIFAMAFWPLEAGEISVAELCVTATWLNAGGEPVTLELPDRSLFVSVADPAIAKETPNVVIGGGIHIDFHELQEVYGSDIKNILSINAQREAASGDAGIAWQPIRLRKAERKPLPGEFRVMLPGSIALDLLRIPAGQFVMGSPEDQGKDDEWPAHHVSLTKGFYIGKYPVTQEQYQAIMEQNPSKFPLSGQHPVDNVSWDEAGEFCRRLMSYLRQSPGALGKQALSAEQVSLPTEAQWEYACRAGSDTLYSFGDDRKQLADYGWFDKNSGRTTQPVAQLKPNQWGVHDMHGNVWEWCDDFYTADYGSASGEDPAGACTGNRRVLRGGSWSYYAKDCRSARRHSAGPAEATANYGFRVIVCITSTE